MSAENIPTTKPIFRVLDIARVKVGMAKMRLNTSNVSLPSP